MIDDADLEYNMALYMGAMQQKYQSAKGKRKQLQLLLNNSAYKIQRRFRTYILKKKMRAAIILQRWWKINLERMRQRQVKIKSFRQLYFGIIIVRFMCKFSKRKNQIQYKKAKNNNLKQVAKKDEKKSPIRKNKPKISLIKKTTRIFPQFLSRKSALLTEHKYINKYRQFLQSKFNDDWQIYEQKLTKQMWKQINKKWVKIQSKGKQKLTKNLYLNDQDKQIDADQYVKGKLDRIYEQFYQKLEKTDQSLKNDQSLLLFALKNLQNTYLQTLLACL